MSHSPKPLPTTTVTFLFTDIEGSTERWEKHREAMAHALERHDACLRPAIESHGGTVFKTIGDAFQAAFSDPVAALLAAAEAQRSLATEDWSACGDSFPALRVRMALHVGPAAADARGDFRTPLLNRVARIESAGNGGQVLLSSDLAAVVAGQLPPEMRLRDLGEHRLKDLRHAERIHQVVAEGMPDIVTALRTAGALDARDRVIVRDPSEDAPDSLAGRATVVERTVAETFAELLAVIRGDLRTTVLTVEQVRAAARHRPVDVSEYRLSRIAAWSQPRYRLDGRFVELTLLVDQGEEASAGRWAAKEERYDDLGKLLAGVPDPAVVVLGPPGSGKSTILRRFELDTAIQALRGEQNTLTFFLQLNTYKPKRPGDPLPAPEDWLAEQWAAAYPDLPGLGDLLAEGRVVLLLDALNEMPAASEREFREQVGLWKDWVQALIKERPGNRIVLSCRTLDYSQPLSTPALRVPQVRIEPMADGQIREFLHVYSPLKGREIWAALEGSPQLDALRSPYFLKLLVEQAEATGEVAGDRAGLFTGFVRQALRREVERGHPLFQADGLLTSRDLRRITQAGWSGPYELPERGALVPKLAGLAYGMQAAQKDGGASQVRVGYDAALGLIDHARDEDIVRAGVALAVLDEDPARDEVLYVHQLVQEYFAARELAKAPDPELVRAEWRAAAITPSVREVLETMPLGETLPPLPTTGWEETTVLAAAMTVEPEGFVRGVMGTNLALAGRCANQHKVRERLREGFLDELRLVLVERSRSIKSDLRHRIACGLVVGELGDPRFERRMGPFGAYLMPPLVEIPGGAYPIGEDDAIWVAEEDLWERAWMPRHDMQIAAFRIGQFPVTNGEWSCFMTAGGYEDERWWDTEAGQAWRRGEGTAEGLKQSALRGLRKVRKKPQVLEQWHGSGRIDDETYERWQRRLAMTDAEFEAHLADLYPGGRHLEPMFWRDERHNAAAQPVVGISWYEARAYCSWLSSQTGLVVRMPTEIEWEAAARGRIGRLFAYGHEFDRAKGNTVETSLRRPTPVGAFVEGLTPEGVSDLTGNVYEWTISLWGMEAEEADYGYPYDAADGREDVRASTDLLRVVRGGSWSHPSRTAQCAYRSRAVPSSRYRGFGIRLVVATPTLPR